MTPRNAWFGLWIIVVALLAVGCPKKAKVPPPAPAPAAPAPLKGEPPPQPPTTLEEAGRVEDITEISRRLQLYDIFFDFDKYDIRPDQLPRAEKLAELLKQNPNWRILIEGHCDERGTSEYNMSLGWRRANTLRDFLVSRGVEAARIQTISYGKERPFALGCSQKPTVQEREDCWQLNRRAHLVAVGK
ncbi:MAG: OmpA family protein [Acidobacteria bacterium]|nr:OmpA family protein [Acidobacteriota bacterium]MDW7984617.1 OmpA family protein [Acidobacteriota bacterium]